MEALVTAFQDFEEELLRLTSKFGALSKALKAHNDSFATSHSVQAIPALAAVEDAQEGHVEFDQGWCPRPFCLKGFQIRALPVRLICFTPTARQSMIGRCLATAAT